MPATLLGTLSPQQFLAEYWQKKPLLVRAAIPGFRSPVAPDELAGLACEDDVEARIILERDGGHPWELRHGPFRETDFSQLPETHWTLLVQECNRHVPELAKLLEQFNFIPNWRIDDVMVSYAPEQGTVGPHTDQYDVFLLQGLGTRRWQINSGTTPQAPLLPDLDLGILATFEPEQEWVLEPGDMLYLPPGVAHHGVALEDCITLSIGFRAPAHQDILTGFVAHLAEQADPDNPPRYTDPDLTLQESPGEISTAALDQVTRIIQQAAADVSDIHHWFGRFITEPKNDLPDLSLEQALMPEALVARLAQGATLLRSEHSRFAFLAPEQGISRLYIDGAELELPKEMGFTAPLICDRREYCLQDLQAHLGSEEFMGLLCALVNTGKLYLDDQ